jgi:hypothetical protein
VWILTVVYALSKRWGLIYTFYSLILLGLATLLSLFILRISFRLRGEMFLPF